MLLQSYVPFPFGQRSNLGQSKIFTSVSEFYRAAFDPTIVINSVVEIGDAAVQMNFTQDEECADLPTNTNVTLAAFVTSFARLR